MAGWLVWTPSAPSNERAGTGPPPGRRGVVGVRHDDRARVMGRGDGLGRVLGQRRAVHLGDLPDLVDQEARLQVVDDPGAGLGDQDPRVARVPDRLLGGPVPAHQFGDLALLVAEPDVEFDTATGPLSEGEDLLQRGDLRRVVLAALPGLVVGGVEGARLRRRSGPRCCRCRWSCGRPWSRAARRNARPWSAGRRPRPGRHRRRRRTRTTSGCSRERGCWLPGERRSARWRSPCPGFRRRPSAPAPAPGRTPAASPAASARLSLAGPARPGGRPRRGHGRSGGQACRYHGDGDQRPHGSACSGERHVRFPLDDLSDASSIQARLHPPVNPSWRSEGIFPTF